MRIDVFRSGTFSADLHAADESIIGDGWVGDETERFFRGRDLADVNCETLTHDYREVWWAAHNFLNDAAYLFFLPALMKTVLDSFAEDEGARLLADALAGSFLRMAKGEQDHRLVPILQNYSPEQLCQVATFLLELSRDHFQPASDFDRAAPALELFWKRYLVSEPVSP